MNNKSQGLSINVIIIVAIALIVLVVLIAIFAGRLGGFSKGVDTAQSCSSTCTASGSSKVDADNILGCGGKYFPGKFGDVAEGKVCCCISGGSTESGSGSAGTSSGSTADTSDNAGAASTDSGGGSTIECGDKGQLCCGRDTSNPTCNDGSTCRSKTTPPGPPLCPE